MPITHWTMLIGALAIAGIPPLAGFFSKDEVLGEAFKLGFEWVWLVGIVVALMTAFYMFRLMGKTFYGESHVDPAVEPKIHESPRSMTVPLILLAGLSVARRAAILGLPFGDSHHQPLAGAGVPLRPGDHGSSTTRRTPFFGIDGVLILVSVAVATIGMVLALAPVRLLPAARRTRAGARAHGARAAGLYQGSFNKWYFDELNDLLFVRDRWRGRQRRGLVRRARHRRRRERHRDRDAGGRRPASARSRPGRVQNYALGIAAGLIVIAVGLIFLVTR